MIFESRYWKNSLLSVAESLESYAEKVNCDDDVDDFFKIEESVFIGFYILRKLCDADKVCDATKAKKINLISYKNKSKYEVNYCTKRKDLNKLYDLDGGPNEELKDLPYICGQIIHSYMFAPAVDIKNIDQEYHLIGIYFNSDKSKYKYIYYIQITEIIELFQLFGNDYPTSVRILAGEVTSKCETISKCPYP